MSEVLTSVIRNLQESDTENEVQEIEHFKYKHELSRQLSMASVLGLSVSIMSVPLGVSSTLLVPLVNGGSGTLFWGWILVCVLSLVVSASLGEMAGKFPSTGGVYHWSFMLSPRNIKGYQSANLLVSWCVGWCLIFGNFAMAISIMFSGAQFFLSIFGIADTSYHPHATITVIVYFCLVIICGIINLKAYPYLHLINKASVHWTVYTVLIIDVLLLLMSSEFNDLSKMLTTFETPRSGWPQILAFIIGLQQAAFTFQGYSMIPSMTDEVQDPEKTVPKGMVLSVAVAGITGIIFILPILACTPELDVLLDVEANILPIELIFKASSRSIIISFLFVLLLCGTIFFGSVGIFTITSRSIYSLARDNGVPYSELWSNVSPDAHSNKIPNNAVYLTAGWLCFLGLFTLVSPTMLYSYMGASVVPLSIANLVPLTLAFINKRRKLKGSAFKMKKVFGYLFEVISIAWCFMMLIIFSFPMKANFTTSTMNYASFMVFIEISVIAGMWFGFGSTHFHGPEIDESYNIEMRYQQLSAENAEIPEEPQTVPPTRIETPNLLGDTPVLEDIDTPIVSEDDTPADETPDDELSDTVSVPLDN